MAALVVKVGALVLRTLAKPLGTRFQAYVMEHPTARDYAIAAAQRLHRFEVWVTRAVDGKTGRTFVPDMTEERSIELAGKVAAEGFVFTVGLVVVGLEYERMRQRAQEKRATEASERAALMAAAARERAALADDNNQQAALITVLVERVCVLEAQLEGATQAAVNASRRGGLGPIAPIQSHSVMQHPPCPLDHPALLSELWPCLGTDDRPALRQCCATIQAAVDAQAGRVEEGEADSSVLSLATRARLHGVHTVTLRSLACLNDMLLAQPAGAVFPRLQSLRLDLGAIQRRADYETIAIVSPWLTHLSLELPASVTALPHHMAGVLSACSKLEDLAMSEPDDASGGTSIANIDALATGTQLLSLRLPWCPCVTSLAPLGGMVNLQSLTMHCGAVSDLAPLSGMVNLKNLGLLGCSAVTNLAPLGSLVNLSSLNIGGCKAVYDLGPLTALVNLQTIDICGCSAITHLAPLAALVKLESFNMNDNVSVSNLAPLAAMVHMKKLSISVCNAVSDLAPRAAMVKLQTLYIGHCSAVSDLAPLAAMVKLESFYMNDNVSVSNLAPLAAMVHMKKLSISVCNVVSDLAPLAAMVKLQTLYIGHCSAVSDLAPLAAMVNLQTLNISGCSAVSDLAPLAALVNLVSLEVCNCGAVLDLAPVQGMTNLKYLETGPIHVDDDDGSSEDTGSSTDGDAFVKRGIKCFSVRV
ncbi:hypothetical protein FOA52_001824 [Chlamydomonas sp. UWO 241]|nr:hypothetical protein FOA52_001824 [Chlamydomonas sp. UWO 241]